MGSLRPPSIPLRLLPLLLAMSLAAAAQAGGAPRGATCPELAGGETLRWCRSADGGQFTVHYMPWKGDGGLVVAYALDKGVLTKTFRGLAVFPRHLEGIAVRADDADAQRARLFRYGVLQEMDRLIPPLGPGDRALDQLAAYFAHWTAVKPHIADKLQRAHQNLLRGMLKLLAGAVAVDRVYLTEDDLPSAAGDEAWRRYYETALWELSARTPAGSSAEVLRREFEALFAQYLALQNTLFEAHTAPIRSPSDDYNRLQRVLERLRPANAWLANSLLELLRDGGFLSWPGAAPDYLLSCEVDARREPLPIVLYDRLLKAMAGDVDQVVRRFLEENTVPNLLDPCSLLAETGIGAFDFALAHEYGHWQSVRGGTAETARDKWPPILVDYRLKEMLVRMALGVKLDVAALLAAKERDAGVAEADLAPLREVLALWPDARALLGEEAAKEFDHLVMRYGERQERLLDRWVEETDPNAAGTEPYYAELQAHAFAFDALAALAVAPVTKAGSASASRP